jgi:hypothetical protein
VKELQSIECTECAEDESVTDHSLHHHSTDRLERTVRLLWVGGRDGVGEGKKSGGLLQEREVSLQETLHPFQMPLWVWWISGNEDEHLKERGVSTAREETE